MKTKLISVTVAICIMLFCIPAFAVEDEQDEREEVQNKIDQCWDPSSLGKTVKCLKYVASQYRPGAGPGFGMLMDAIRKAANELVN